MFLISGITGHIGGAATRRLLADGREVRAITRDPAKAAEWTGRGVDVVAGDFTDAGAIAAALDGVEGAFLMMPPFFTPGPGFPEARAIAASFAEALHRAPPPLLTVLSSVGSERDTGLGMITATHLLEAALSDLSFPTAFLRAGSLLENYTANLPKAAETGLFDTFLVPVDHGVPMIATEDVGNEVARLLTTGWRGRKIVEIGSRTTPNELASAMSTVVGRPVTANAVPRGHWSAVLEAQGMPPAFIGPFTEMEDGFNSGWIDFGVSGTDVVPGRISPAEVFAKAGVARSRP